MCGNSELVSSTPQTINGEMTWTRCHIDGAEMSIPDEEANKKVKQMRKDIDSRTRSWEAAGVEKVGFRHVETKDGTVRYVFDVIENRRIG